MVLSVKQFTIQSCFSFLTFNIFFWQLIKLILFFDLCLLNCLSLLLSQMNSLDYYYGQDYHLFQMDSEIFLGFSFKESFKNFMLLNEITKFDLLLVLIFFLMIFEMETDSIGCCLLELSLVNFWFFAKIVLPGLKYHCQVSLIKILISETENFS